MKWFKVLAVLALAVLAVSVAPSVVRADGPTPDSTLSQVTRAGATTVKILKQTNDYAIVGIGGAKTNSQAAIANLVQPIASQVTQTSAVDTVPEIDGPTAIVLHDYYSANGSLPYSDATVQIWYTNTHARGVQGACGGVCNKIIVNGTTYSIWYGYSPYYPSSIRLTESWAYEGIGWTIIVPPGGNFSVQQSTAIFDSGVIDAQAEQIYSLSNTYAKVKGKIYGILFGEEDTATASYRFGSQIISPSAVGCGFICG